LPGAIPKYIGVFIKVHEITHVYEGMVGYDYPDLFPELLLDTTPSRLRHPGYFVLKGQRRTLPRTRRSFSMKKIEQSVALLSVVLWSAVAWGQDSPEHNNQEIDSGDAVRVDVAGHSDLSGRYTVDESGRITLPLGDPVDASGLTPEELERAVVASLKPDYLVNPRVSVKLVDDSGESAGRLIDGGEHAQVSVDSLRVRRGPSSRESVIGGLTGGAHVVVTERSEGWCAVVTAGGQTQEGWVACRLLTMTPDASAHTDHDFGAER
jgi:hypothetical protein